MGTNGGFEGAQATEEGSLEEAIAAAGAAPPAEEQIPAEGAPQEAPPAQTEADWRAGLDPETRQLVESKGFRTPGDLARWGREAEAEMHRARQEAERIAQQAAQMGQPQPQQEEGPGYNEAQVFAALDNGDITPNEASAYIANLREYDRQQMLSEMDKRLQHYDQERVQPLGQVQASEMLRGEIQQVQAQVGQEELQRYGEQAIAIRGQMGISFQDAYALAKGRAETAKLLETRRSQYAETANGGARGRAPVKSDAEILAEEIFGSDGPISGGFG